MSKSKHERMERIGELYFAGYSRRAIAEAFGLSKERVKQILTEYARGHRIRFPPRNPQGRKRYDHSTKFKPIPVE